MPRAVCLTNVAHEGPGMLGELLYAAGYQVEVVEAFTGVALPSGLGGDDVLVVMGGVFVMETVSVMLQVSSYKTTGRRIFRMAPIHHHFELKGWPEPRVIVRFWIISVVLVLVGLATLKVR